MIDFSFFGNLSQNLRKHFFHDLQLIMKFLDFLLLLLISARAPLHLHNLPVSACFDVVWYVCELHIVRQDHHHCSIIAVAFGSQLQRCLRVLLCHTNRIKPG